MPQATPAFVVTNKNNTEYSCVLPIDVNTGMVILDTDYCVIRKGDKETVAKEIEAFFRSAGIRVARRR